MHAFKIQRERMVQRQLAGRGIHDTGVLEAMGAVPRERFVPERLHEFAYHDTPLPIDQGQTISQPFIVALMVEAAAIMPDDNVLEVGAGSGYAAAVMGRIGGRVHAIERHVLLAQQAAKRMDELGYDNVTVTQGDGTLGCPEHAPFDAIVVSAGGPDAPASLLEQLRVGGRLVIPVGDEPRTQELLRIRRISKTEFERDSLGRVQFVPLVGSEGWSADGVPIPAKRARRPLRIERPARHRLSEMIAGACEPFHDLENADLDPLLHRIGNARVVMIGEATHGSSEFYRMRARITRELIERRGFTIVAIEGDWPDARVIDRHVRGQPAAPIREAAFTRFPTWMWRNDETRHFMHWLWQHNRAIAEPARQVSVHGLDLYSLNNSIGAVLDYLDRVDTSAADEARVRYGCFSPWETDPATYGRATVSGRLAGCERQAVSILTSLLMKRLEYLDGDPESFFDAERNATVVREAEQYYRVMYYGSRESWNLRDQHMFETLQAAMRHRGEQTRAVVWAHNSHVGNATATEMGRRGELNIGQLAREAFGAQVWLIGCGTDHGTVAAASNWDEPMEVKTLRPSHPDSYECLCHESGVEAFLLHLRQPAMETLRTELLAPRLERAIGVIYRPDTEMVSHYFQAALPAQFDEYIWFDETTAVHPLVAKTTAGVPDTYPFGL